MITGCGSPARPKAAGDLMMILVPARCTGFRRIYADQLHANPRICVALSLIIPIVSVATSVFKGFISASIFAGASWMRGQGVTPAAERVAGMRNLLSGLGPSARSLLQEFGAPDTRAGRVQLQDAGPNEIPRRPTRAVEAVHPRSATLRVSADEFRRAQGRRRSDQHRACLPSALALLGIALYIGSATSGSSHQRDHRHLPLLRDDLRAVLAARTEFTLPPLRRSLTIAGYSVNDTVVVYDRIRARSAPLQGNADQRILNLSITIRFAYYGDQRPHRAVGGVALPVRRRGGLRGFSLAMIGHCDRHLFTIFSPSVLTNCTCAGDREANL